MLLFFVLIALMDQGSSQMLRVIGGTYASPGYFRYQVSLQLMRQHFCGGSIISETFVITAAHCTYQFDESEIEVVVGAVDLTDGTGKYIGVDEIIEHPDYNDRTISNDIALIKLVKSLRLGTIYADKIEISNASLSLPESKIALLSGYGRTSDKGKMPNRLKYALIPIWLRSDCIPHLRTRGRKDRMICAGAPNGQVGSCKGDSGGPLSLDGKLYGLVSWGFGCGVLNKPSIYTYVPGFRSWIQEYVNL